MSDVDLLAELDATIRTEVAASAIREATISVFEERS
jgi:hypothetical protein